MIFDEFVKSRKIFLGVIPAKAGIQFFKLVTNLLDPGFRRGDGFSDFLQSRHF